MGLITSLRVNANTLLTSTQSRTVTDSGLSTGNQIITGYQIENDCLRRLKFSDLDSKVTTLRLKGNEMGLLRTGEPLENLTLLPLLNYMDVSDNGMSTAQIDGIVNQLYQSAQINALRNVSYNIIGNQPPSITGQIQLSDLEVNYGFINLGIVTLITDNSVDQNKSFTFDGTSGNVTVNWGDGTIDTQVMGSGAINFNHTYSGTGINTIRISGDISNITFMQVDSSEITNANIDQLTNLTTFSAAVNSLTTINLANNTKLINLGLADNASLASLDVSTLVDLELIETYLTAVTTLDISNNIKLTTVSMNDSGLTTLDISNNPLITGLNLSNNAITAQADIDKILTDAAAAGLAISIDIAGGTNAAPSTADGVPPISTIVANGGAVIHN